MCKRILSLLAIIFGIGAGVYVVALYWLGINIALPSFTSSKQELHQTIYQNLQLPTGFSVTIFADGLSGPRFMKVTPLGDVLVSEPSEGRVLLLRNGAQASASGRQVLIAGLNRPHGLALYQQWLYIAETDAIGRVRFDANKRQLIGDYQRIITGLPNDGGHWTRTVGVGPDKLLYVAIGSSCNVCEEKHLRRAAILRYQLDGSGEELLATGLRNSVGFAWAADGSLYANDNGRDWLGDNLPPDELNLIVPSGFYGWPYAYGQRIADNDYYGGANKDKVSASLAPVHEYGAHNAPLGITFLASEDLPKAYQGAALVALHGSWNSSSKVGYKLVTLHWLADGSIEERDFVTGFMRNGEVIGRPVDVAEGVDGQIYVSDDFAGVIYQIRYRSNN